MTQVSARGEQGALAGAISREGLAYHGLKRSRREQLLWLLRLFWFRRQFLYQAAGVGLLLSAAIAFLIPARYESTAQLMPPDDKAPGIATIAALAGQAGGMGGIASDLLAAKSNGEVFVGILRSRSLADMIIEQLNLEKVYHVRSRELAETTLKENTSIVQDRKSGMISISVTDKDPTRAAAIAGAYVTGLNELSARLSTSSARRERIFLEGRLEAVMRDLESAEKDLSEFSSKNATIDIKEQGKTMVEAAAALQGQLIAAQTELEGLKQIYSANHVRVRAAQARVDELSRQLSKLGGKSGRSAQEAQISAGDLYPSLRGLPLLGVEYADLYRRAKVQEAVFETLTNEAELAKIQEAKEIPTVMVLDPPNVPEHKYFPPRLWYMMLGTICVVISACLGLVAREHWKNMDPEDPCKLFLEEILHTTPAWTAVENENTSGNGSWRARLKSGLRRSDKTIES